jgi:hypothetical protein
LIRATHILYVLIISSVYITGCASKLVKAKKIATHAGLKPKIIHTTNYKIQSFYRITTKGTPIFVYIEGDGLAWLSRYQPSSNPTPKNPLALRLAALDQSDNVVYLARPCQYVDLSSENHCSIAYWTHKRFAKKVIIALNEAISIMSNKAKSKNVHLIGYSGGGAVVAMIAAKRRDVSSIRTVAGYMDHVTLNQRTIVSPLIGSLDPIKAAPRLKNTPQIHYSGKEDKRVPGWVLKNFRKAVGSRNCITLRQVEATHEEGWEEIWGSVWSKIPECR